MTLREFLTADPFFDANADADRALEGMRKARISGDGVMFDLYEKDCDDALNRMFQYKNTLSSGLRKEGTAIAAFSVLAALGLAAGAIVTGRWVLLVGSVSILGLAVYVTRRLWEMRW